MRTSILFVALLIVAARIQAADPAPPKHAAPPKTGQPANTDTAAKVESAPKLEVKNKSTFNVAAVSRSPFWPIGWKPVAKISTGQGDQAGPEIPQSAFAVSSITLGAGGHFAIINGKIMEEGQQFGLQIGNQTYHITVKAIEDGRVVLSRRDSEIIVPLRRK